MGNKEKQPSTGSNTSSESLTVRQSRHCIFISGMGGFYSSLRRLREGLDEAYGGSKNVTVFNSIYSSDQPNHRRFEQIADSIAYRLEDGPLDIVANSLGATELYRALSVLEEIDENYFGNRERNENLHIILVGPSGSSRNFIEKVAYARGVMRMARKELTYTPLRQKSETLIRGVASLTQFPAETIPDIARKIRSALPKTWSNRRSIITDILFEPKTYNRQYLTHGQIARLTSIDERLNTATSSEDISALLRQRGEIAKEAMQSLVDNTGDNSEDTSSPGSFKPYFKAKGLFTTLIMAMGGGPLNKFKELAIEGVQVSWLVSEFDYVVPIDRALRFYDQLGYNPNNHIRVQELWPHTGPLAQPSAFGQIVFSLHENITGDSSPTLPPEAVIFKVE